MSTETPAPVRIVLIDDDRLARECLTAQLSTHGFDVTEAWDTPSLLMAVGADTPSVVLLNVNTRDSATLLQVGLDTAPGVQVSVFGLREDDDATIVNCADGGATGLHLRSESFADLLTVLHAAARGESSCSPAISAILVRRVYALAANPDPDTALPVLTAREEQILKLIEDGLSNQEIASRLTVALHTVKNHVHSLLTKLGVSSRAEAVAVARAQRTAKLGAAQPN